MRNLLLTICISVLTLSIAGCPKEEPKPDEAIKSATKAPVKEEVKSKPKAAPRKDIPEIIEGGLYIFPSKYKDYFMVMKVLSVEPKRVHLIRYANKLQNVPEHIDASTLTLGHIGEENNIGMEHMSLGIDWFWPDKPVFIQKEPITPEDLVGYNEWKARRRK